MAAFTSSAPAIVGGLVFTSLLVAACVTDVRERRIPNAVVLALAAAGVAFTAIGAPLGLEMLRGLATLALGFALWMPLYAFGRLGAGDVKLFAAASAWLSPMVVLNAALLTALAGGVLAIVWLFRSQGALLAAVRLTNPASLREPLPVDARAAKLPYGVAMAVGLSLAGWSPFLPL